MPVPTQPQQRIQSSPSAILRSTQASAFRQHNREQARAPASSNLFTPRKNENTVAKVPRNMFDQGMFMYTDVKENLPPVQSRLDHQTQLYLKEQKIDHVIEQWAVNAKNWFSQTLVPNIMAAHKDNLRNIDWMLKQMSASSYQPLIFDRTEDPDLQRAHNPTTDIDGLWRLIKQLKNYRTTELKPSDELERYKQILTTRSLLDRYFELPGGNESQRNYVTNRMYSIMRERHIMGYRTDSINGNPSDADIIAHWVFTLINNGTNVKAKKDYNIYDKIVYPYSLQPSGKDSVVFWQVQRDPEYKMIIGKQVISPPNGGLHMFWSFALWLHYVKAKKKGKYKDFDCSSIISQVLS